MAPLEATVLLVWFAYDTIRDDKTKWYEFGKETFMMCIVQVLCSVLTTFFFGLRLGKVYLKN